MQKGAGDRRQEKGERRKEKGKGTAGEKQTEKGRQNLICGHVGVSKADNNDNLRSRNQSGNNKVVRHFQAIWQPFACTL